MKRNVPRWEYDVDTTCRKDYYHGSGQVQRMLERRGEEGWELVQVLSNPQPPGPAALVFYYKRPATREE